MTFHCAADCGDMQFLAGNDWNVNLMISYLSASQPLLNILICHLSGRLPSVFHDEPNRLNILIFQGLFLSSSDLK